MCALPLSDMLADGARNEPGRAAPRFGAERRQGTVIIIDKRTIIRECLAQSMRSCDYEVETLPSVDGCADLVSTLACDVVILCGNTDSDIAQDLTLLQTECGTCPVLVIFDAVSPDKVIDNLELGARGVLPTSSSLGLLHGVITLIRAGGTYVPPDSMIAAQRTRSGDTAQPTGGQPFTARQSAIISAIRKGSPNKIIAYELGMCESTVKVHIRNIMKKLKVRNRTELAFKASELRMVP
jgi:DNA-binding NarL/FixJ family response regulator